MGTQKTHTKAELVHSVINPQMGGLASCVNMCKTATQCRCAHDEPEA